MPPFAMLPGLPLIGAWSASGAAVLADIQLFNGNSLFGGLGAVIIVILTVYLTFRTNAVKYWRDTAEAREQRIKELSLEAKQQRDLKHEALSESANLKLRTDLTPLLERMIKLQEGQSDRAAQESAMASAIESVANSQEHIAQTLTEVAEASRRILQQIEVMVNGREKGQ